VLGPCAALIGGIGSGEGDRVVRGLGGMLSDGSVKRVAPIREGPLACARYSASASLSAASMCWSCCH
jgi:hypothetical protein